jgi:ABC-type nitrate/sulfonate/bicarbonate transport system substrate-binding protein
MPNQRSGKVNRRKVVTVFAMLLMCAALHAQAPAPLRTIHLICLPGVPLPVQIAKARGIFSRYGIEVIAEKASSATALREALASHTADIAHSSVENAVVSASARGTDDVIVMGGEGSTSELIVQAGIQKVSDLRGHTIILDGADTAYTLLLKKILSRNGLKPGVDCEMKVIGLAPQRLQAMGAHPEYAATIQKPPTSILSERAGLKSLGSTDELSGMGRFQGIGAFTLRPWAKENSDLLERYIAAFVEAQRWMMDPANKKQVIALMADEAHMPQDVAEQTYAVDMKDGWSVDAQFDVAGFKNVLALQQGESPSTTPPPDAQDFYDLSWYRNAMARLSQAK